MFNRFLFILLILFFTSGASALIYQIIWFRLLGLVFGVTVYAATTVLASFMSGLALGSFFAGKLADKKYNPFFLFGLIELLIGLSTSFTPQVLELTKQVYISLYYLLPQTQIISTLIHFSLSFSVLIIPTTLMGMTLPIVIKSSLLQSKNLGKSISLLYAINTTGAVIGTLLAGIYLIGQLGIKTTFYFAILLNILVGLSAIIVSFFINYQSKVKKVDLPEISENNLFLTYNIRKLVLIVFILSGFASLAMEVIWFRALTLFFPLQTTYGYTIMLATLLFGMAFGSYLITPFINKNLNWVKFLAVIEIIIGLFSLILFEALSYLYDFINLIEAISKYPLSRNFPLMILTSFISILPIAILFGVAFPIGMKLWVSKNKNHFQNAGKNIGLFYSLNVLAGIIGSIIAGFILLPILGSKISMAVLSLCFLGSGLLLIYKQIFINKFVRSFAFLSVLLFIFAVFVFPNPVTVAIVRRFPGERTLWQEEGIQATVSIHEQSNQQRVMYLDGVSQTNDSIGMSAVHRSIGYFPMLIHPKAKDVLVIGLGGGATAGAISNFQNTKIDVVEISNSIVNGSNYFININNNVLEKKNVNIIINDARNHLLLTSKYYDIAVADIQPYHAGAGKLYSTEYFQLVKNSLKDDGLMLQWIGQRPETEYKLIMRTFLKVFPNASLWYNGTLLVGPKNSLKINLQEIEDKLKEPKLQEDLKELNFSKIQSITSAFTANSIDMKKFVGDGLVLTDDRPMIEYYFFALPRNDESIVMQKANSFLEQYFVK